MESVQRPSEEMMIENLNKDLNSPYFVSMLAENWSKYNNTRYLGDMIGEVYNFHILFKDGIGFHEYMDTISSMYDSYYTKINSDGVTEEDKKKASRQLYEKKSRYMASFIAKRLGIDPQTATPEDALRVKEYFLREYVENGFVSHSFPDAYRQSITQGGLIATPTSRGDGVDKKMEIQKMFMKHGVVAPLGGYPYYGGAGIYYEHDFHQVYFHALGSPEWFKWFTSADHTNTYHEGIDRTPYVLRDEMSCRRNVSDLCFNAGLTEVETMKVMAFYRENYARFQSPRLNVALIPKRVVGKDKIEDLEVDGLSVVDTIMVVMGDKKKQYLEHIGNVSREDIPASEFYVTEIPAAKRYITPPSGYAREGKGELLDTEKSLAMIEHISSHDSMVEELKAPLAETKEIVEKRKKQTFDTVEQEESFDARTPEEVQIAGAIRRENEVVAKRKKQNKELNKGYVYTLKKKDNNDGGFVSSIILSVVVGVVFAAMLITLLMVVM